MPTIHDAAFQNAIDRVHFGDCRDSMRTMIAQGVTVQTCVTSPPYFGLRDYGHPGQLGLESSPDEYVSNLVDVFRLVRDLLADDGTLWLNLGDSYASIGGGYSDSGSRGKASVISPKTQRAILKGRQRDGFGLKQKDLIGIPWRVAFALQADGWYLRQDIIWSKPNPMPESVTDRCTKSHEYVFLLSKSPHYFFDHQAIREPAAESSLQRWAQDLENQRGSDRAVGKTNGPMKAVRGSNPGNQTHRGAAAYAAGDEHMRTKSGLVTYAEKKRETSRRNSFARKTKDTAGEHGQKAQFRPDREPVDYGTDTRNKRSVWNVATVPFKGAHFATFPPKLIEPCVLAGSRPGDVVLDPFFGSGTTGQVCQTLGRHWIGCEINPAFQSLQNERTMQAALILA